MPRLFVAVNLPESVRQQLGAIRVSVPTARVVKPTQMHLTLRFISDQVPDEQVESIKAALSQVAVPAFEMRLDGVGRFPPQEKKAPRVLWVGVDAPPELAALHRQIEQALAGVGFTPEGKLFSPHITLARLQLMKAVPEVQQFLNSNHVFATNPFPVRDFVLYASTLTPQGPQYSVVAVYPLQENA
jgi:RNA 2',3'-cyclic 3'-phosphodiesterase